MMKNIVTICVLCLIPVLLFAFGCGDGAQRKPTGTGQLSGCVTWKGNPVANATVRFTNSDGVLKEGKTDDTGNYRIESLSAGPYMVGIEPANPKDIPMNYVSPSDSGLVFTVLGGKNQADFKL